jgi:hypothetical protein
MHLQAHAFFSIDLLDVVLWEYTHCGVDAFISGTFVCGRAPWLLHLYPLQELEEPGMFEVGDGVTYSKPVDCVITTSRFLCGVAD